ncbi:MAG: prepilin-type N-terminal cleavage/methylation domain-containing protein [Chthoniobacterales bacterium]
MREGGVTLIELLVAVAIVAILAAIAVPGFSAMRARAESAECLSNLRQLGIALNGYLGENDLVMPTVAAARVSDGPAVATIDSVLLDYAGGEEVFRCPADPGVWRETGTSYFWNPTLSGQRATALSFLNLTEALTRIPVLSDKEGWHRGGGSKVNVLYADGHATSGLRLEVGK